jgi:DNA-binding NarL/FixJ family response regulator
MRIVLATGDTDLRLAIQLMLSEEPGLNIIGSASDCAGLIALINSNHPDLALVDWNLPECNFEDLIREVKTIESETKLTLIVLGKRSTKEAAIQAGADDYLVKGDPPDILLEAFRQLNIN